MKLTNGFNARRLRSDSRRNWPWYVGMLCAATLLLSALGAFILSVLVLAGKDSLFGSWTIGRDTALAMLPCSLVMGSLGRFGWRRCRRRLQQHPDELTFSPQLLRKRH